MRVPEIEWIEVRTAPPLSLRVIHVITGLQRGGAELALARLLRETATAPPRQAVVALTGHGPMGDQIQDLGIPVFSVGGSRLSSVPAAAWRLHRLFRRLQPDIVQTWMYHADLIGGIAARRAGVPRIIWGLRQGDLEPGTTSRSTLAIAHVNARLSRHLPDAIVACSDAARRSHMAFGYAGQKMRVIPNGFDVLEREPSRRGPARDALGLPHDATLVGAVGRLHPHKDQRTFLETARLVADERPDVRFLLCGAGTDQHQVRTWVRELKMTDHTYLLGERTDMDVVYASLDILCSTSVGEGFPNVIGEALASGLPVIATDVGDSSTLIGPGGRLVRSRSPLATAAAVIDLVDAGPGGRDRIGQLGRGHVAAHFGLQRMASRYLDLWEGG